MGRFDYILDLDKHVESLDITDGWIIGFLQQYISVTSWQWVFTGGGIKGTKRKSNIYCESMKDISNTKGGTNSIYYTLRFYFPYLSLLVQLVNILVYWLGPINIMFSSGFCPNSFFCCLRYTITKTCRLTDLHVLSII
jgi:hypothetical protein